MNRIPNTQCFHCNKDIYVRPGQMSKQKTWFCSRDCYSKINPIRYYTCVLCEKKFRLKNRSGERAPKFCSRECANRGRTGIKYGQGQPRSNTNKLVLRRAIIVDRDGPNCKICNMEPIWNGLPLVLQVDHIDGDNKNNDPTNWRLLCPNCHSQTETFGGKNIKKKAT